MQTNTSKTIHKLALVWQILNCISILIGVFFTLGFSWVVIESFIIGVYTYELPSVIFLVFGLFLGGFTIYFLISSFKIYAMTSPVGLEYHGIGIHIHTPWENTTQIELVGIAARFGIGEEVIKLSKPPQILSSNWLGRLIFRYQKGIPLLYFGKWRSSPLGFEIHKYAPKLLS